MKFTAQQIAQAVQGVIEGDPKTSITDFAKIEEGTAGTISFLANPKYTKYLYSTKASIVIVNEDFVPEQEVSATLIRVKDAYAAFAVLMNLYKQYKYPKKGIARKAKVSKSAKIGENVYVGEFAVIGDNVEIGDNVKIYPNTTIGENSKIGKDSIIYSGVNIYHETIIGENCIVHSGTVIGSDGFGFAPVNNNFMKIPQIGNVVIEDNVEIGANVAIDRATMGSTIIHKNSKIDNLVQIAHNVEIGENTVLAGQVGISGSTKLGDNIMCGGQVGIAGHITVGNGVKIAAQSGISASVKDEEILFGSPALNARKFKTSYVHFRNLDKIVNRLNELEAEVKRLKGE